MHKYTYISAPKKCVSFSLPNIMYIRKLNSIIATIVIKYYCRNRVDGIAIDVVTPDLNMSPSE
jgi:hypothetical protein